jgi:hypothetical protein
MSLSADRHRGPHSPPDIHRVHGAPPPSPSSLLLPFLPHFPPHTPHPSLFLFLPTPLAPPPPSIVLHAIVSHGEGAVSLVSKGKAVPSRRHLESRKGGVGGGGGRTDGGGGTDGRRGERERGCGRGVTRRRRRRWRRRQETFADTFCDYFHTVISKVQVAAAPVARARTRPGSGHGPGAWAPPSRGCPSGSRLSLGQPNPRPRRCGGPCGASMARRAPRAGSCVPDARTRVSGAAHVCAWVMRLRAHACPRASR